MAFTVFGVCKVVLHGTEYTRHKLGIVKAAIRSFQLVCCFLIILKEKQQSNLEHTKMFEGKVYTKKNTV